MVRQLFGIDFGTTNSLAALVVGNEVRSLVNEQDNRPHPSVVWYRGTDAIVGREARNHLDTMHAEVAQGFVRSPKMALRREGPLHIEGQVLEPTDVIAQVLRHLRNDAAARRRGGYDLSQAVMTVPVDFGGSQRRDLRDAARKADIGVIQFVHEPAAALYAFMRANREMQNVSLKSETDMQRVFASLENRNVLVFDWGGGTLDLNLCRIAGGVIYQIATRGNNDVGGDRFDERLMNLVREKHLLQYGLQDTRALEQPGATAALAVQCELAKIELSVKKTHTVLLLDYMRGSGSGRNLSVEVSRSELEDSTRDIVNRGLTEIDSILEKARLDRRDIELCLATGGITNMPAVWAGLIERFGGRVPKLPNADRIIAEGAALIAHDGLRPTLAKPIEILVADGTSRGAYLPIAAAGIKMPVENSSITIPNRRFFCVDPSDGMATFQFAKPMSIGLIQPSDDRETICVASLPVDPGARPLLERLECELQIDHNYIAHATLRSFGRQGSARLEFHQLEFALALPSALAAEENSGSASEGGSSRKNESRQINNSASGGASSGRFFQSNITLRSNLTPIGGDGHVDDSSWFVVPGDLIHKWRPDLLEVRAYMSALQKDERGYYLPCAYCKRSVYNIRTEGPNEVCWRSNCSEVRKRPNQGCASSAI